jgi:hypothetical protein
VGREKYLKNVRKPEGKRPLGRTRREWEDNVKIYKKEMLLEDVDRNCVTQDVDWYRFLFNVVMSFVFHKRRGISCLPGRKSASRHGLPVLCVYAS